VLGSDELDHVDAVAGRLERARAQRVGEQVGLPPEYAIVGKVSYGMNVVDRIGKLGDASGQPTQTVVIRKVSVVVS